MPKVPNMIESEAVEESVDMMNTKCVLMAKKGKHAEAIACYDDMIRTFGPSYGLANYMKGAILVGKGEYDKARVCFIESAKISPDNADTKMGIAFCDARTNRKAEAVKNMNEALELAPNEIKILITAALLSCELGDSKKSEELMKMASKINPYTTYNHIEIAVNGFLSNPALSASQKKEIESLLSKARDFIKDMKAKEKTESKKK